MSVEVRNERFREVVGSGDELEQLGTGFEFTEGATWDSRDSCLIFSDMPVPRSASPGTVGTSAVGGPWNMSGVAAGSVSRST